MITVGDFAVNISTPVHEKGISESLTDDAVIVKSSLVVSRKLEEYLGCLKVLVKSRFSASKAHNKHQSKLHGLAWTATYVEALKQMSIWGEQLFKKRRFGKTERIILILSFNEYLNQIFGGIMMSQNEIIRPADLDQKKRGARETEL
ncbi:hypothetical protein OA416_04535 [Paracoccaceae bacterium]|nr:hypothetical protein [Paracoccaceae bacterium]